MSSLGLLNMESTHNPKDLQVRHIGYDLPPPPLLFSPVLPKGTQTPASLAMDLELRISDKPNSHDNTLGPPQHPDFSPLRSTFGCEKRDLARNNRVSDSH